MGEQYLICKNGMYYRANAQGYTSSRAEAGRYSLADAIRHSHPNGPDGPRDGITYELAPPEQSAPEAADELTALRERDRRTMSDTQRLIWRDDVEGICPTPDMCFEYGEHVRCGPCAIKQATACGVASDLSLPNLPEVSRQRREIAALNERVVELEGALSEATEHLGLVLGSDPGCREQACRQEALKWWLAYDAGQERAILSRPQQGGGDATPIPGASTNMD